MAYLSSEVERPENWVYHSQPIQRRVEELVKLTLISGFRRDVDEICAILVYYNIPE
jgi:hypothetical protein